MHVCTSHFHNAYTAYNAFILLLINPKISFFKSEIPLSFRAFLLDLHASLGKTRNKIHAHSFLKQKTTAADGLSLFFSSSLFRFSTLSFSFSKIEDAPCNFHVLKK